MRRPRKRTLTLRTLPSQLLTLLGTLPQVVRGYARPQVSRALREQVMLATTSVNDCRYCAWVHGRWALAHGVDLEALRSLLAGEGFEVQDDRDAIAILYAQSFAETGGAPDAQLTALLHDAFGENAAAEITTYVKGITFANLAGNTLDALLARLRRS